MQTIADIRKQEDILIRLLQDYTDRFYRALKAAYEGQFYDIVYIKEDDDSLQKQYQFEIENDETGEAYEQKIKVLQELVESGKLGEASQWNAGQMVAICFEHHLYYPWFSSVDGTPLNSGIVPLKMRPLSFDAPSEVQFVRDLEVFYHSTAGQQLSKRLIKHVLPLSGKIRIFKIPRQQGFNFFNRIRIRQRLEHLGQIRVGFQSIGFGRLN